MKKRFIIASLLLALIFPCLVSADLINVTCDGVDGNLVCRDVSGNIIYTVDATNRKISIPSGSAIDVESGGYFKIAGTAVTATAAKLNMIPADGGAGEYLTTDGAGTWSWGAGTSGSLDDAYNSGAAITVDGSAVTLNASHGTNDAFFVNKTAGTGDAIQITNAGTGYDIAGTSGTWYVTKAGVASFASFSPLTAGLTITGGTVTGDGTAALGGFLKTVTDDADGEAAIGVAESGSVQTNAGAAGAAAWVLPDAAAGLNYTFIVMAAQEMQVTPAAGDKICVAGVCGDAAEYWSADAVGESITIVAVDATNWVATSYTGTWTQDTP